MVTSHVTVYHEGVPHTPITPRAPTVESARARMQILVKVPMAGKTFEIDVDSDDTIKSIKAVSYTHLTLPTILLV